MDFDFAAEGPKILQLLYGLIAFVVVVGGLLLALDAIPNWFDRRREQRESARRAAVTAAPPAAPPAEVVEPGVEPGGGVAVRERVAVAAPPGPPGPPKRHEGWMAAGFMLPALVLLAIGLVIPGVRTILLSFKDGEEVEWVGLQNYSWIFSQDEIVRVVLNTAIWVLLVPTVATSIGLIYAVLVDRARMESVAKSLIFMPMAISFVGAGIIWRFVYAYRPEGEEQIGLLNQIWVTLGGEPKQWLTNAPLNTLLLIVVLVWIQAGFAMVVLSAAIKAIPGDIVEAARLDGVNAWQMFWRVTLPTIWPAVIVVVVTISIGTLKVFDIVRTMTNGNFDTNVVALEMYNQAFRYNETGQGAALAVFLFVLVLPIVIYQIRHLRQRQEVR
ncbi:MAG TPA: sugar ABC transporter permease [Pilimelia sp.]|nr:sugar ABC transporter permease [Pilimelia sp.]